MMRKTIATLTTLLALMAPAHAADDTMAAPVLRASVNVTSDVVRVGDLVDNAGPAAQIAVSHDTGWLRGYQDRTDARLLHRLGLLLPEASAPLDIREEEGDGARGQ